MGYGSGRKLKKCWMKIKNTAGNWEEYGRELRLIRHASSIELGIMILIWDVNEIGELSEVYTSKNSGWNLDKSI